MPQDLYTEFLHLPPGPRPPNHYEILALAPFEPDKSVIHAAVLRQTAELKRWVLDPRPGRLERVQEMLNEVGRAGFILEDLKTKAEYDRGLAERLGIPLPAPSPPLLRSEGTLAPTRERDAAPRRCPRCRAPMKAGDTLCSFCGYDASTARPLRPGRIAWFVSAALGLALLVVIAILIGVTSRRRDLARELGAAWKTWQDTAAAAAADQALLAKYEPSALPEARKSASEAVALAGAGETAEAITLFKAAVQAVKDATDRASARDALNPFRQIPHPSPLVVPKVVEPKKDKEPKKPDEPKVVTPKKDPEQPKTPEDIDALPEGAKIEERVVARGSGQKLIFEKVAHCDAVVQLPEPLRKALSFDTTATKAGLRVNYTDQSGMPAKLFDAQFSPAERKWVWDLGGDARGKYSAWLEYLVMTAVDTREPQKVAAYRCRCERKEEVRELLLVLKEDGSSGPKERASATFDYPWPETLMVKHPEHKGGAWSSLEDLTKREIELERSLPRHTRKMVAYKPKAEQVKQQFTCRDSPEITPRLAIWLTVSIGDPDPKTGAKTVRVAITSPELCAYLKSEAEHHDETQKMDAVLAGAHRVLAEEIARIEREKEGARPVEKARLPMLREDWAYVEDLMSHVTKQELEAIRQRWRQLKEQLQDLGVLNIRDPWELPVAKLTPRIEFVEGKGASK